MVREATELRFGPDPNQREISDSRVEYGVGIV